MSIRAICKRECRLMNWRHNNTTTSAPTTRTSTSISAGGRMLELNADSSTSITASDNAGMISATTERILSVWRPAKLRRTPTSASIMLSALSLRYAAIKNGIDNSNAPLQPSAFWIPKSLTQPAKIRASRAPLLSLTDRRNESAVADHHTATATGYRKSLLTCRLMPSVAMMNQTSPICAVLMPRRIEVRPSCPAITLPTLTATILPTITAMLTTTNRTEIIAKHARIEHESDGHEKDRAEHVAYWFDQSLDIAQSARFGPHRAEKQCIRRLPAEVPADLEADPDHQDDFRQPRPRQQRAICAD